MIPGKPYSSVFVPCYAIVSLHASLHQQEMLFQSKCSENKMKGVLVFSVCTRVVECGLQGAEGGEMFN